MSPGGGKGTVTLPLVSHGQDAVLPTPAVPPIAVITTGVPPGPGWPGRASIIDRASSSRARPVKPGTAAGSIAGRGGAGPVLAGLAGPPGRWGSTGAAGSRAGSDRKIRWL